MRKPTKVSALTTLDLMQLERVWGYQDNKKKHNTVTKRFGADTKTAMPFSITLKTFHH